MCGNVQAVNACTKVGCEWWGDRHGPMQMDIALATGKMWMHCAEAVIKNLMQSNGKHAVFWSDVRIAIEARAGKGHKNWYGKAAQLMKKYGWNKAPDIKRPSPIASCNGHEEYAYVPRK